MIMNTFTNHSISLVLVYTYDARGGSSQLESVLGHPFLFVSTLARSLRIHARIFLLLAYSRCIRDSSRGASCCKGGGGSRNRGCTEPITTFVVVVFLGHKLASQPVVDKPPACSLAPLLLHPTTLDPVVVSGHEWEAGGGLESILAQDKCILVRLPHKHSPAGEEKSVEQVNLERRVTSSPELCKFGPVGARGVRPSTWRPPAKNVVKVVPLRHASGVGVGVGNNFYKRRPHQWRIWSNVEARVEAAYGSNAVCHYCLDRFVGSNRGPRWQAVQLSLQLGDLRTDCSCFLKFIFYHVYALCSIKIGKP
mmetsp:Transcript_30824/g.49747  ORF Transcript_30824/g.49747 Transcript_30824/m.49747 type:complete len:308 (-) Transcript_30824:1658-2581(-)